MTTRPCPFCGNTDPVLDEVDMAGFAVLCETCGATGPIVYDQTDTTRGQESALREWNRRSFGANRDPRPLIDGMQFWWHYCTAEGTSLATAAGEPCNWCGARDGQR